MSPRFAYEAWKSYAALVEELEAAANSPDHGIEPPRVSPLFDCADMEDREQVGAAQARAKKRLMRARELEAEVREELFRSLDKEPKCPECNGTGWTSDGWKSYACECPAGQK